MTIRNGHLSGAGAGISNSGNLTILNCTVSGNTQVTSGWGGGIYNDNGSTLNVTNSIISGNSANGAGGGIANFGTLSLTNSTISGNSSSNSGGGIFTYSDCTLNVTNSTISGNTATLSGGGIFTYSVLILTNTTLSGNSTSGTGSGGGGLLTAGGPGTATLTNVTITDNHAAGNGGGVLLLDGNDKLRNTIVAGNVSEDDASTNNIHFNMDTSAASSNNLIGPGETGGLTATNGNQINVANPGLGALANNGGPTQTHALLPSSPALNAGSNTLATNAGLTTDQRGFARIVNTTVDIGAFESRGFTIAATSGTPQSAPIMTAFASPLLATVSSAFGEPVAGGVVTFTAPPSGASGTFTGNLATVTSTIDASGMATAPVFTANSVAGGSYNVVASLAGGSPSANFALTNLMGNQTITVNTHAPATASYNSGFTVAASSNSGLAVTYSSAGVCTNVGSTFTMTSGAGTCTVRYDQSGDSNYNSALQVTESVTAQKANQTITVNTHAPANATYNTNFTVAGSSNSGLAVTYSISGVCTNVGSTFTMTSGTGTCTVRYDQSGDGNYNAAPQVTESVTAQKANQSITFGALSSKAVGDPDFGVSATASSSLTVNFTASPASVCTISANTVHITGAGACTITAKQTGDTNYSAAPDVPQLFNVASASTTTAVSSSVNPSEFGQSVTFTATVASGVGTPTGTVQFKDSGVNMGAAQSLSAGGVAQVTSSAMTAGTHTITAVYSGDTNFLTSSGTLSGGQVVKMQPSLSINDVSFAEGNSGTTNLIFTVTLSAASNLTVNVNYATANGTATLADNDYQAASGTLTFNPGELTKTITVLVNGDQKFEPDETVLVNLSSPVNAAISDNQGSGTILNDDTLQLLLDEAGPDANQAAAFDSLLFIRDPFHVQSIASWIDLGPDRNTRVIVFAANLQLNQGETASAVVVSLVDAHNQSFDVAAEDVQPVPNFGFTQVRFRLPNSLAGGVCMVTIKAHNQISNTGTIRIVP